MRPNEYNELLKKIRCSDDFRKSMQEKLSSASDEMTEYEDSVSGTDVITAKHRWGKFAAMAAAFVLVCGAVGGGAYHLANVNKTTKESSDISEAVQYASIYSRLKANKELYHGSIIFKEDQKVIFRTDSLDIEPFISYMDKFDTDNMIDEEDFDKTGRSITIDFYDKKCDEEFAAKLEQAANDETINRISLYDEASYNFTLYNNGCFTMTDNEYNRTTYHCFTDGEKVFNDILEMYELDKTLDGINSVSKTEMMRALESGFDNYNDGKAYYYPANSNKPIECIVSDRSGFKDELWEFEWKSAGIPSGDVDHYYLGFTINVDGYMQIYINDIEYNYKLKNDSDLEEFNAVLKKHLIKKDFGEAASKEDILSAFAEDYNGEKIRFRKDDGQFTGDTECTATNFESLKNELSDFEWVTCKVDEPQIYENFYIAGALISRNGYIYPQSAGTHQCAYKLKNESDVEKLCELLDKYIEIKSE